MKRLVVQVSSTYERNGEKKWRNSNVGSAFQRDNGEYSIVLDPGISIASIEGVRITLREPFDKDKHGGGSRGGSPGYDDAPSSHGADDDMPY